MSMYIPIIKYLQLLLLESTIINNNDNDNDDDDDDDDVMVIDLQVRIAPNAIYNYQLKKTSWWSGDFQQSKCKQLSIN